MYGSKRKSVYPGLSKKRLDEHVPEEIQLLILHCKDDYLAGQIMILWLSTYFENESIRNIFYGDSKYLINFNHLAWDRFTLHNMNEFRRLFNIVFLEDFVEKLILLIRPNEVKKIFEALPNLAQLESIAKDLQSFVSKDLENLKAFAFLSETVKPDTLSSLDRSWKTTMNSLETATNKCGETMEVFLDKSNGISIHQEISIVPFTCKPIFTDFSEWLKNNFLPITFDRGKRRVVDPDIVRCSNEKCVLAWYAKYYNYTWTQFFDLSSESIAEALFFIFPDLVTMRRAECVICPICQSPHSFG